MRAQMQTAKTGTYLIPNLLTAFNLICGILAILLTLEGYTSTNDGTQRYTLAAWLLLAAMLFDYLDGKVARWTHTESSFGIKVDSLTDFVSFGIGPMVLTYMILLRDIPGIIRALACGFYLFAGAWRLARFNCEAQSTSGGAHSFFTGLPIPAASAFLCTLVLVYSNTRGVGPRLLGRSFTSLPPTLSSGLATLLLIALAFLMVSRIPFPAFKKMHSRNLIVLCGAAIFFGVLVLVLPLESVMFLIMLLYVIVGLFNHFLARILSTTRMAFAGRLHRKTQTMKKHTG